MLRSTCIVMGIVGMLSFVGCTPEDAEILQQILFDIADATNPEGPTPKSRPRPRYQPPPSTYRPIPAPPPHSTTVADQRTRRHDGPGTTNNCIKITFHRSKGAFFQAKMQNVCDQKMHVTFGHGVKLDGTPIRAPWCTPRGSMGGSTTLDPGEREPFAPISGMKGFSTYHCACSDVYYWAAFAEPVGPGPDNCTCRCASH